jgi:hypothetical protein
MNFSFFGRNFKLKFELPRNFELHSIELTTFYYIPFHQIPLRE